MPRNKRLIKCRIIEVFTIPTYPTFMRTTKQDTKLFSAERECIFLVTAKRGERRGSRILDQKNGKQEKTDKELRVTLLPHARIPNNPGDQ